MDNRGVLLPVGICIAAGLIFVFLVFPFIQKQHVMLPDPDGYMQIADNMYRGFGFTMQAGSDPIVFVGPSYPVTIWLLSFLTLGVRLWAIQILNVLLHAAICCFLYRLAERIYDSKTAKYAAIIYALYPPILLAMPRVYVEHLFSFFMIVTAYFMVRFCQDKRNIYNVAAGLMLGLACLTRSLALALPVFYLLVLVFQRLGWKRVMLSFVTVLGVSWIVIAPWMIRNHRLTGKVIPVHTGFGFHFIMGSTFVKNFVHAPIEYGDYARKGYVRINRILEQHGIEQYWDLKADAVLRAEALKQVAQEPSLIPGKLVAQSMTYWYLARTRARSIVLALIQFPMIVLAFLGLVHSPERRVRLTLVPLVIVFSLVVINAFVYAIARYSLPAIPYLLLFAGYFFAKRKQLTWDSLSGLEEKVQEEGHGESEQVTQAG